MPDKYKTFNTRKINWLQDHIETEDEVIDFGCGFMPITRRLKCKKLIGIDVWYHHVVRARKELDHLDHIQVWNLDLSCSLLSSVKNNSIDISIFIDVIEHFEKDDALCIIKQIERITRKKVLIFTPNGFLPQEPKDGNKYQVHRCGFRPSEFEDMGYDISWRMNDHGTIVESFLAVKELVII